MVAKTAAQLFVPLGVNKSHSRPHVSNDNPYSKSQFKTVKYCPGFRKRFGSLQDAVAFCRSFFTWYNTDHRHSGIGMLAPGVAHYGLARHVVESWKKVLEIAFEAHPDKFVRGVPFPPVLPEAAGINSAAEVLGDRRLLQYF